LENNIYVSWNASNGANYYEVYRAPTASGAYEKQSERVVDLFWRDIYTEPGVTYWYKVKACNWNEGGTCSELSTSHNDGLRTGPPMPPTNLQASDGAFSDKIRISWNAVPGADFYLVKSNTVKDLETATPTCAVTQTSCDHESITPGTLYYYWICTYSGKYGEFSNPETGYAQGPPTAPNNVQASDGEFVEKVRLTWEESPSAEAYRVYRHTENNPNAATSIGTSNNTFFDDTTAVQGQIYWYWVKSLRHSYPESGFSIPADTGYRKGLPAPTNLGVSKGNYIAKVRLLWNTVANAQYYGIYRNTVFNFETSQFLSTISNNYYDDLNTEEGTLYYYWVTAGNDAFGEGGKSVPDKGYWKGLSAPTQLQASDGTYTDKIHLTWVAADHAQSYKVYRSTINIPESATLIGETSNTFFDDTNVDQDWVYTYWITSVHDLLIVEDSRFSAPDIGYASDEFLFRFDDVPDGYWAEDYIYRLHASGITIGCSQVPPLYCPEQNVTRAEMAVFLERGLNDPGYLPPPGNGALFADVPITYWAVNWIEQLYTDGITVGCDTSPLRYCPDQSVTRAEMSAFLLRAKYGAGFSPPIVTESQFADVPLTHWAVNWVARLAADGITTGVTPTQFNPEGFVTRAQMAAFLVRTFELP
jgi:fibronectin type 3 domain-containing protein